MRPGLTGLSILFTSLLCTVAGAATPPAPSGILRLFDGAPRPEVQVMALAPDSTHPLVGESVTAETALRTAFPGRAIELARTEIGRASCRERVF